MRILLAIPAIILLLTISGSTGQCGALAVSARISNGISITGGCCKCRTGYCRCGKVAGYSDCGCANGCAIAVTGGTVTLASTRTLSQSLNIVGTVTDPRGAPLAGRPVALLAASGAKFATRTDRAGRFLIEIDTAAQPKRTVDVGLLKTDREDKDEYILTLVSHPS